MHLHAKLPSCQRAFFRGEEPKKTHLVRLLSILEVELVQSFYMIAGERDRHKHCLLLAKAREALERVARLWAHPRTRPHLRLPHEAVGIRVAQTVHHGRDRRGDLEHVRVAAVDDRHGE